MVRLGLILLVRIVASCVKVNETAVDAICTVWNLKIGVFKNSLSIILIAILLDDRSIKEPRHCVEKN